MRPQAARASANGTTDKTLSSWLLGLTVFLSYVNGMYYGSRVVASHAVHELKGAEAAA